MFMIYIIYTWRPLKFNKWRASCNNVLSLLTCFVKMHSKVSHDYRSLLYAYIVLQNQCDNDYIILWPLADPYINDHFKIIHCLFSQNDKFRLVARSPSKYFAHWLVSTWVTYSRGSVNQIKSPDKSNDICYCVLCQTGAAN